MRFVSMFSLCLLVACGPSAAEREADVAAATARKDCGRTYSSLEKAYQDKLYAMGKADVEFVAKDKYLEKCVELGLTKDALRCADPNLAEGSDCKALAQADQDKVKSLVELMLSPMKTDKKDAAAKTEGEAAEGAAAGGETPAGAGE